jgi:hypothetical protein
MGNSVTIITPIPTLEEVGKSLKISKARQKRLIEILTEKNCHLSVGSRHRDASDSFNGRARNRNGDMKLSMQRNVGKVSALSKKSKHDAAC